MPFHVSATQKKTVDMMKLKKNFMYTEAKQLQAQVLKLNYKGGQLSMVILLPKKNNGLKKLEAKLASLNLADILDEMYEVKVEVYLPKFKLEHKIDLRDTLEKLGMKAMFDPCKADLTGISDSQPGLVVSRILHKAFIEVNEEGTEAAAATGAEIVLLSLRTTIPRPVVFKADHPFLFLLISVVNKAILFIGRVQDVESSNPEGLGPTSSCQHL
ncbi:leukocyte elastase inhibitor-like [Schistocerca piceifrons]|uniref:leukocyte elastase inhibitor-like n=1 Tax=Schistocerca piceifrons TaxID=274613 RepID=UPI001F5F91C0|nr:leukocyte elastase inhibitor-like [Schistocerca piceifrons]